MKTKINDKIIYFNNGQWYKHSGGLVGKKTTVDVLIN
jgi:hypothetical protein